ncbi:MAG: transposase, partial [Candidatus Omnitrophota bacterium]
MGLTMEQKKAVTNEIAKRYQKASKKQKGVILDEIVEITK